MAQYALSTIFASMEKQWLRRNIPDEGLVEVLREKIGISSVLASLMAQRKLENFETAKKYFNPHTNQLHDPFLMKGMHEAVERIKQAMVLEEKILFYGDYDVDGTTSVSLISLFFQEYPHTSYYIPSRQNEGYGVSAQGVDFAHENGFSLIIAMDCGIKASEQVRRAKELGVDFIICDHHTPGEELPEAVAILDPKQEDCPYPYKELSGCGLTFKLCCALSQHCELLKSDPFQFIDLVVVSIASDIVPVTGENRVLAHFGLNKLNSKPLPGIERLKEMAGYTKSYTVTDVVFKLGPRINAAGRISDAKQAVELMVGNEPESLDKIGVQVNHYNDTRRQIEQQIIDDCLEKVKQDESHQQAVSTVVYGENWHKGVIGIVASKLVDAFYKPTVVLTKKDKGFAVGSARSVEGFNLYRALKECDFMFEQFGGHQAAAGLTLPISEIENFQTAFDDVVRSMILPDMLVPKVWYDSEIALSSINWSFYNTLERMGPFGPENMRPTFVSRNAKPESIKVIGQKHLKFKLNSAIGSIDCIGFNFGHVFEKLKPNSLTDICYMVEVNEWQGDKFLQLNIKDLKIHEAES